MVGLSPYHLTERVTGIEPALSAWKADVLPEHFTRMPLARRQERPVWPPSSGPAVASPMHPPCRQR